MPFGLIPTHDILGYGKRKQCIEYKKRNEDFFVYPYVSGNFQNDKDKEWDED